MKQTACCLLSFFLLLCDGLSAQTTEKQDSMPSSPQQRIKPSRISLSSLTDGLMNTIRLTGVELKKVGKKLNDVDTTYISPNKYNLAFMLEQSTWFEHYRLGSNEANGQSLNFAPNATPKIGVYFGWRWIFLGISFDIKSLLGKNDNTAPRKEFVFNLYSGKFGVDLYYRKTGSNFKMTSYSQFNLEKDYSRTDFTGFQSNIKGLNAYWIFNHKHFSYPAAYSQSTNQRKSCGSLMAGFAYSQHNIKFDYTCLPEEMQEQLQPSLKFHSIRYTDYNLSLGYGYNWVFARNCLACLSLNPAVAYKTSRIRKAEEETDEWYKNFNIDFILRVGIVYNNSKYFAGTSFVGRTYDYYRNNFSLNNGFGTLQVYAGFNFCLKKEHRKKKQ